MSDVFEKRLRRAEVLEKEWPFAAELLSFFKDVFRLQSRAWQDLGRSTESPLTIHDTLHLLSPLLDLAVRRGPASLRPPAELLRTKDRDFWATTSIEFLKQNRLRSDGGPEEFFVRVLLEPCVCVSRQKKAPPSVPADSSKCPSCGERPMVSVLREDKAAETVRRSFVCWLCSFEWDFPRVLCPKCGEERPEKLPRYTAQEIPWMRVEACDSCGKYLKSVDLTLNWDAEPVVDELASTPLDVIAHEHGYTKIAPNLAGL